MYYHGMWMTSEKKLMIMELPIYGPIYYQYINISETKRKKNCSHILCWAKIREK